MNSPSFELAQNIASRLSTANLINADDVESLTIKMSEGKLKKEDWRLAIEKGIDTKEKS